MGFRAVSGDVVVAGATLSVSIIIVVVLICIGACVGRSVAPSCAKGGRGGRGDYKSKGLGVVGRQVVVMNVSVMCVVDVV